MILIKGKEVILMPKPEVGTPEYQEAIKKMKELLAELTEEERELIKSGCEATLLED